jgi:hypothetical protein
LNFLSSLRAGDQVLHIKETTGKTAHHCISMFAYLDRKGGKKSDPCDRKQKRKMRTKVLRSISRLAVEIHASVPFTLQSSHMILTGQEIECITLDVV